MQQVFLRMARRDAGADPVDNVGSFLHRAAINAGLNDRANIRSVPLEDLEPVLADSPHRSPDRLHVSGEIRDWLRTALARLNPRIAQMFAMRFFEGKSNPDIALLLNTTPGILDEPNLYMHPDLRKHLSAFHSQSPSASNNRNAFFGRRL